MHQDIPMPDEVLELAQMIHEAPTPTEIHGNWTELELRLFNDKLFMAMSVVCHRLTFVHFERLRQLAASKKEH